MFQPSKAFNLKVIPKNINGKCEVQFNEFPDDLTLYIFNAMGFTKPKNSLVFVADETNQPKYEAFAYLMQEHLKVGEYPIDIAYEPKFIPDEFSLAGMNFSIFSVRYIDPKGETAIDTKVCFETLDPRKKGIAHVYGITKYGEQFLSASLASRPKKTDGNKLFYSDNFIASFPFPFGNGLNTTTVEKTTKSGISSKLVSAQAKESQKIPAENLEIKEIGSEKLEKPKKSIAQNSNTQISVFKNSDVNKSVTQKIVENNKVESKSSYPTDLKSTDQLNSSNSVVLSNSSQISATQKIVTEKSGEKKGTIQIEKTVAIAEQQRDHYKILTKLLPNLIEHIDRGVRFSESLSSGSRFSRIVFKVTSESIDNIIDLALDLYPKDSKKGNIVTILLRLNQHQKECILIDSDLKNKDNEIIPHSEFNPVDFESIIEELLGDGHLFELYEEEVQEIVKGANEKHVNKQENNLNYSPLEKILLTNETSTQFLSWEAANKWLANQVKDPNKQHRIYYSIKWQNGDELVAYFELFTKEFHPQFETELLQKVVIIHLLKNHYKQENRFVDSVNKKSTRKVGFYLALFERVNLGNSQQKLIEEYQPKIPATSVEVITKIITTENKNESNRKFDLANDFLQVLKLNSDPNELIEIHAEWRDETKFSTSIKLKSIPTNPGSVFWKTLLKSKTEIKVIDKYQVSDDDPLLFDSEISFETPAFYYQPLENAYWFETDKDYDKKIYFSKYLYHQDFLKGAIQMYLNSLTDEEENDIIELASKNPRQKKVLQFILDYKKLEKEDSNLQLAQINELIEEAVIGNIENAKTVLYGILLRLQNDGIIVSLPKVRVQQNKKIASLHKESKRIQLNREIESLLKLKKNDRLKYSLEEIELLKKYSGYGGSKLSEVNKGLLYEYYTPDEVVKYMWGFAIKHGYRSGAIMEPSCGVGKFISYAPKKSRIEGYEINSFSAQIAALLYPNATIHNKSFESLFFNGNVYLKGQFRTEPFDLVIGNPPYGSFSGKYAGMGEKKRTKAFTYDQYFLTRGLDLLNPNGLLIMVIPQSFLDNTSKYNSLKESIAEKATFIEARRLPHGIFQHTEVGTDIVVFRKK